MIDDHPDLERRYRAPRAFGPMPGPRNIPFSQRDLAGRRPEVTTSLSVTLEADPDELARLLPPATRLEGPAELTVTATRFEHLRWLAGRGYAILTVTFPVAYVGPDTDPDSDTDVVARYLAVVWESLADPVTTGRDELAFPKLFADVHAPGLDDVSPRGSAAADASWDGFCFLDLAVEGLHEATEPAGEPSLGTLVHRFVPATGHPDRGDLDQLVLHPRRTPEPTDRLVGTGRFGFHHARFEDVPVQFPVINALAGLTLGETGRATLVRTVSSAGSAPGAIPPRVLGLAGTVAR